jgi:imidazolonepropionase-like amidohydrolase
MDLSCKESLSMKRYIQMISTAALFGLVASCSSGTSKDTATARPEAPTVTFFSGARLIPGDGSAPMENATFLVDNGKITELGAKGEVKAPKGAGRAELDGQTVMPVLVNLNAHPGLSNGPSFGPENYKRESVLNDLNRYLYYGVAAVVSTGSDPGDVAFQIRDEQRQGKTGGAQLFTAGRGITAKGGWPTSLQRDIPIQVGTEAEARKAVADQAEKKVDFIRIWMDAAPKLKPELYRAIIDEAHKGNVRVLASAGELADAKDLVKSGVDGLLDSIRDREVDSELIASMKEKNTFYAPGLTALEAKFIYADKPSWLGEQAMREVYPAQLSAYLADTVVVNRFKRNPELPQLRQQYSTAAKNLKKLADGGVKIAFGTNSGSPDTYPGYFEHRELQLMVEAGMTGADAIKAATLTSAEILGLKDLGALKVGKNGDFLALSTNPLEKIENSKEIALMFRGGNQIQRLPLIQNITIDVPRITQKDRQAEAEAQAKDARDAAEAKLEHFGKFPLGPSAMVRAMAIPTPKGSTKTVTVGPPDKITVSIHATPAELREFYSKALPRYSWKAAAGGCWERQNPISNKPQQLCIEPAANSAQIQIAEK